MQALIRIFHSETTDFEREVPNLQHARGLAKRAIRNYPAFMKAWAIIFIDGEKVVTISMRNGEWICEYEPGHMPTELKAEKIAMKRAGWYTR